MMVPVNGAPPRRDGTVWAAVTLASAAALYVCYGVATETFTLGSARHGWFYGYYEELSTRPFGAALIAAAVCVALLLFAPADRVRHAVLLLAWVAAATILHGVIRSLTPVTLEQVFRSEGANSFYTVSRQVGPQQVLAEFAEVQARSPLHAQSNMPGKVLLLHALQLISSDPSVLPWLLVLISNLGSLLMYAFVRDTFDDRRVAFYSAVLYLFVPGRVLFFPLMNTVTPVVVLSCACVLMRWLKTARARDAALLGCAVYGLVLFEPLPLTVGLLFAALILRQVRRGGLTARGLGTHLGVGAAAFAAAYGAMYAFAGFDMLEAFRHISRHAAEFNVSARRPYGFWLRENLKELAFGTGICQTALFAVALANGIGSSSVWRMRLLTPAALVPVSLLAVVIATDLLGISRGEVVRLWIFLACLLQIPAALVCASVRSDAALAVVLAMSLLQTSLGTALLSFLVIR